MIIVYYLLVALQLIFLARVLLSWFPNVDHSNPLIKFIYDVTEPILRPIRQALPQTGMMDFSSMVVLIGIWVIMQVLFR
jgi:YggT family protein